MAKKKAGKVPLRADQRISDVAQRWFLLEPLLFSVYCTHVLTENSSLEVPLRSGRGRIEYNAGMVDAMEDRELADRLKVEALRILLKHPYLRQPFRARPEILYLSSNMTILDNMGGPLAFCFELVPQFIEEAMPAGKTFEEYYCLLNRLIPQLQQEEKAPSSQMSDNSDNPDDSDDSDNSEDSEDSEDSGKSGNSKESGNSDNSEECDSSGNSKECDNSEESDKSGNSEDSGDSENSELSKNMKLWATAASQWEEDSIMTVDINMIIQVAAAAGSSKLWGSLSADFVEFVKASLVPPIDVANILKGFKKSILSNNRVLTRMRPSRRYGFAQMGSKYPYTTRVLVALDVSGSVDSDMLSRMLAMINRIFKQGVKQIDVIQFDANLTGPPETIRKTISSFKVTGRGGTDFQPAADFYISHPEYDGLIYITDGIAPNPVIPKKFSKLPVTWIITDEDLIPSIRHGWKSGKEY